MTQGPPGVVVGFLFGELLLLGGFFHFLPRLTRPDIFFAVTVSSDFPHKEKGREILRRFRTALWLHTMLAAGLVFAGMLRGNFHLMFAGIYWQLIGGFLGFRRARQQVLPHAAVTSTEREAQLAPQRSSIRGGLLQLGPFAMLLASGLYLQAHWAAIPTHFAVHWGADGRPNGWASRTFAGVYGPLFLGTAVCLMMIILRHGILHWTRRVHASGPAAEYEARFRRTQVVILLSAEYFIALTFSWTSLLPIRKNLEDLPGGTSYVMVAALAYLLAIMLLLVRTGQGGSRLATATAGNLPEPGKAPVGDRTPDHCWKAGIIYFNPDDPAILVEKRFGIGYTFNFGRPATWILLGVLALVPLVFGLLVAHRA